MRSFFSARNLLPCKRKNHLGRWFDRRLSQLGNCLTVVTGFRRAQQPNLSFQCSRTLAHTSRATACQYLSANSQLPMAAASGVLRAFPGWTQDDSYRKGRSSRAERGVRAYSPAWSERPKPSRDTSSVSYEKAPRFPKGKKAEQVSGKRQGRNRRAHCSSGAAPFPHGAERGWPPR